MLKIIKLLKGMDRFELLDEYKKRHERFLSSTPENKEEMERKMLEAQREIMRRMK